MRLKQLDFSKRIKLGFFERKMGFSENLYEFCQYRKFCHIMDSSQIDVKFIQEKIRRSVKSTWKICIFNDIWQLVYLVCT